MFYFENFHWKILDLLDFVRNFSGLRKPTSSLFFCIILGNYDRVRLQGVAEARWVW